jgi:hypothetical protein
LILKNCGYYHNLPLRIVNKNIRGELNVAGVTNIQIATVVSGSNIVRVMSVPSIPFILHDDDMTGDVPEPDVGGMEQTWKPAYILPRFDTGNDTPDAPFHRNSHRHTDPYDFWDHLAESRGASFVNRNNYWSVLVKNGFQTDRIEDNDPDTEAGENWRAAADRDVAGVMLLEESIRDWIATPVNLGGGGGIDPDRRGDPGRQPRRQEIVNHEVGHLFGGDHPDGGVMVPTPDRLSSNFTPVSLDKIRKCSRPGEYNP